MGKYRPGQIADIFREVEGKEIRRIQRLRDEKRVFPAGIFYQGIETRTQGTDVVVAVRNPVALVQQYHEPAETDGRYFHVKGDGWNTHDHFIVEGSLDGVVESSIVKQLIDSAARLKVPIAYQEGGRNATALNFVLSHSGQEIGKVAYQRGVHEGQSSSLELTAHENVPDFGRLAMALSPMYRGQRVVSFLDPITGKEYLAKLFDRIVQTRFSPDSKGYIPQLR